MYLNYRASAHCARSHSIPKIQQNGRIFGYLANSFQECGLASVCLTNHKDTKVVIFLLNVEGIENVVVLGLGSGNQA
jgi:hypothetical protein